MRLNKAQPKRKRDKMSIIYDIALVIVIAALLVFIIGWAYDWGLKANQNYKIELEHMVGKEQFTNAVLEEGLKMNSEALDFLRKKATLAVYNTFIENQKDKDKLVEAINTLEEIIKEKKD